MLVCFLWYFCRHEYIGREKVVCPNLIKVCWRDTASGMSTIPNFITKLISDLPSIILGASFYSMAVAMLFPYQQSFRSLFTIVLLSYLVSFSMGYWISTAFTMQRSALVGVGFAKLWALVFSGVSPDLYNVLEMSQYMQAFWAISPSRWFVEAFWLIETELRPWIEKTQALGHGYFRNNFLVDLKSMLVLCI